MNYTKNIKLFAETNVMIWMLFCLGFGSCMDHRTSKKVTKGINTFYRHVTKPMHKLAKLNSITTHVPNTSSSTIKNAKIPDQDVTTLGHHLGEPKSSKPAELPSQPSLNLAPQPAPSLPLTPRKDPPVSLAADYSFARIPTHLSPPIVNITDLDQITDEQLRSLFTYRVDLGHPEYDVEFKEAYQNYRSCNFVAKEDGKNYQGYLNLRLREDNGQLKLHLAICNGYGVVGDHCAGARQTMIQKLHQALGQKNQNLKMELTPTGACPYLDIELTSFMQSPFFKDYPIPFFKDYPISQLAQFMANLPNSSATFANEVAEILSHVEDHLKPYDTLQIIQDIRATSTDPIQVALPALACNKRESIKTKMEQSGMGTGYGKDLLPQDMQKHKRVRIPNSPFWVSIDVVTGEAVIRVDETLMYFGDLPALYIQQIKETLAQYPKFVFLRQNAGEGSGDGKEYYYLGSNSLYFCQDALKALKSS